MLKLPSTYDQQIEKLREHGCIITDADFCKDVLAQVSYYRLSAYFLPFKKSDGMFIPNTKFKKVFNICEFDRKLRTIIYSAIEDVEIFLRAQFSYYHGHKYGSDGYMDSSHYSSKHDHNKFIQNINEAISKNNTISFVKHHISNYSGGFPIWVIMELFTFSMLSYFFADLLSCDQKALSRSIFNTVPKNIESWLHCISVLRNICAHYGRLYYRILPFVPSNINQPDGSPFNTYVLNRLFGSLMALRQLYPSVGKWNNETVSSIHALIDQYIEDIELGYLGFPINWEDLLRK